MKSGSSSSIAQSNLDYLRFPGLRFGTGVFDKAAIFLNGQIYTPILPD